MIAILINDNHSKVMIINVFPDSLIATVCPAFNL